MRVHNQKYLFLELRTGGHFKPAQSLYKKYYHTSCYRYLLTKAGYAILEHLWDKFMPSMYQAPALIYQIKKSPTLLKHHFPYLHMAVHCDKVATHMHL